MSKKGTFALLAGLLAGAATGVLFSPTSGKKFREKLQKELKKGGYGQDSIYQHFKGIAKEVKDTAEEGLHATGLDKKVKTATKAAVKTVKKAKKAVKATKSKAKKVLKNAKSTATKVEKKAEVKVKTATKAAVKTVKKAKKAVKVAKKTISKKK